jgi:hypothetical protein
MLPRYLSCSVSVQPRHVKIPDNLTRSAGSVSGKRTKPFSGDFQNFRVSGNRDATAACLSGILTRFQPHERNNLDT